MNNKELINAGHALAKAISNDTPLIEIAKMVSNLATQLDVQLARSNQLSIGLEAAEKRIAELSHHLQCAHGFIEHTEAFGHEASNGILCCGDAQWNIDESKSALAAAGKGE